MPEEGEPASEEKPERKRSGRVTLILMAGCGALAYSFARLDPSQREEEVRVYRDPQACLDGHLRTAADCRSAYATALALYPRAVPRYGSLTECERVHGRGECLIGEREVPEAEKQYVPTMTAYVVGVTAEQGLPPQPAFGSACIAADRSEDHDHIRYVTGSGASLAGPYGGGSVVAHAPTAELRAEPDTLRKAVFGGFGQTGRTCIPHSSGGG